MNYGHYNIRFNPLLMGFHGNKVTNYYGIVYSHEILDYCGIFRALVQLK
jgi:hypothetical protein